MTTTTTTRTNENGCEFSLFKTPLRTPMRHGMLSSATLNDISSYSNKKHLKFISNTTSMNDLQSCSETNTTPIRFDKIKLSTPASIQRRRALGLVNQNSNHINRVSSSINNLKQDESFTPKSTTIAHSEDDLPHTANHIKEDTFEDLMPTNERIERMITDQINGINLFTYYGGIENTIRCQSPVCHNINVSTLLDMFD